MLIIEIRYLLFIYANVRSDTCSCNIMSTLGRWCGNMCVYLLHLTLVDLLWALLCGYQPIQEVPHLHPGCYWLLQGQEKEWDSTSHLRSGRQCLQWHVDWPWKPVNSYYVCITPLCLLLVRTDGFMVAVCMSLWLQFHFMQLFLKIKWKSIRIMGSNGTAVHVVYFITCIIVGKKNFLIILCYYKPSLFFTLGYCVLDYLHNNTIVLYLKFPLLLELGSKQ